MASGSDLGALQAARRRGIGRLMLLARDDFIARLDRRMKGPGSAFVRSTSRFVPYVDVQGTRSTELARRMGVTKQAVGRVVRQLEEAGLIELVPDPADRRAALVRFTPAGVRYVVRLHRAIDEIEREYDRQFGVARMKVVRETLAEMAYGPGGADRDAPARPARRAPSRTG